MGNLGQRASRKPGEPFAGSVVAGRDGGCYGSAGVPLSFMTSVEVGKSGLSYCTQRGDAVTTTVEESILVNVPVSTAYNQWTQFQEFPQFMAGIKSVRQVSEDRLEWVAEIAGVRRRWEAKILEQIPDQKIAWAATEGATNAGAVTFEDLGGGQTSVRLSLEYEPEGLVELVGDKLNVVAKRAKGDLDRFKAFIEAEGYATGAWRGTVTEGSGVGIPGLEDAVDTQGDKGKAGVSGKTVAGATAAVAGAVAAAAVIRSSGDDGHEEIEVPAESLDVGTPLAAQPTDVEPQSAYRPEDAIVTPRADAPSSGSNVQGRS